VYPRQNNLVQISLFCLKSALILFTHLPLVLQKANFPFTFRD